MIRRATEADIPGLVEMGRRFHASSHWPEYAAYDESSTRGFLSRAVGSPDAVLLVAERENGLAGVICLVLCTLYFNAGVRSAQELFWYSESPADAFRLLREAERLATAAGATIGMIGSQAGARDGRFARAYVKSGYQPFTHGFVRRLNDGH